MLRKHCLFIFLFCFGALKVLSQNPNTITFPNPTSNPPNLAIDSYTRAVTKINLQPGSKYGFVSGNATNLLNLSIGTYPANVSSSYLDTLPANNIISVNSNLELSTTDGNGNVNPIGAFSYQFPIFCSPGVAGMQPNLSISYNSNGSIGNMGLGFNISGISAISRTNKLFYFDGLNRPINLDNADVFSLDGDRLLLKTGTYGQNGSTYKTEVENYSKIISVGNSGNGPNSFVIHTPDGKTMEFGNSTDSKLKAANNNEVLSWYLNKITDEFGNYMRYFYISQNGEVNIDRIEYTGNVNANLNPYNKIKFEYIERSDKKTVFFGGGEFNQTKILKNISCFDISNSLVKKYTFDYQYNNQSLLSKITEVDAFGNQLNPTHIDWTKTNLLTNSTGGFSLSNNIVFARPAVISYTYFGILNNQLTIIEDTVATTNGSNLALVPADLNGDGKKDLLSIDCIRNAFMPPPFLNSPVTFPTTFDVYLSTPGLIPNQQSNFQKVTNSSLFNTQTIANDRIEILATNVYDEDDDNIDEVFITYKLITNLYVIMKVKSDGVNYNLSVFQIPKFISTNNYYTSSWHNGSLFHGMAPSFVPQSSFLVTKADITGDNKPDQIIIDQEEIRVTPSNSQPTIVYPISDIIKAKIGDFNGDGVSEIYLLTSNPINCPAPSNGLGTFNINVLSYNASNNTLNSIISKNVSPNIITIVQNCNDATLTKHFEISSGSIDFADFNGDGKTDILYNEFTSLNLNNNNPGSANFKVSYSTGINFTSDQLIATVPTKINGFDAIFFAGDLNNDGKVDWNSSAYDNTNFVSMFNIFESNEKTISTSPIAYSKQTKYAVAMGDFDGNGTLDYLSQTAFSTAGTIEYNVFNRNTKQFVNHIYNIKNDYKIEYSLLVNNKAGSNYPLYRKSTSNNPSNFNVTKVPLNVVTKTNFNDMEKNYAYENSLFHRQAKGFVGFEKFYTLDPFSNIATIGSYLYDGTSDYLISSSTVNGFANSNPTTFLSIITNSISSKNTSNLNYIITGSNRYLSNTSSINIDYLKSTKSNNVTFFDNSKNGLTLSTSQFSTPWNSPSPHIIENSQSFTYIGITNPFSGQTIYKPLKITNTKISNGTSGPSTSTFDTDFPSYDAAGHLITKIENSNLPGNVITTTYGSYNNFGSPTQITITPDQALARTSQVVYDNTGRFVIKSINAIGNFEECTYETKFGNKIQCKDISGLVTNMQYDGLGRLIKTVTPNNAVNTVKYEWYSYNPASNPSKTCYAGKITTKVEGSPTIVKKYDINNNLVETNQEVFGGGNKIVVATYNAINLPLIETELATIVSSSGNKQVIHSYDNFLRPSAITQKIGNNTISNITYAYNNISTDASYNKGFVQAKAPNSNAGQFNYVKKEVNEAGQNDKTINFSSLNVNTQHISAIKYNQFNLPYEVSNTFNSANAIVTTINYDALGRQQQLTDPSSGITTYQYNSIGELLQQTTPNGSYSFAYDILGRLTTKNSNNNTYNYQYVTTANGKQMLDKITGPNEITEYKYDNLNRLIEKKQTVSAANNKILKSNYTYNKYGQVVDYIYPGGFKTTSEYDAIGTLSKIKNNNTIIWQLDNIYTPALISQYTYGNGLVNSIAYDPNQSMQQKNYGGIEVQNYNFAPQNSDLLARDLYNSFNAAYNNENFKYDDFNRLTTTKYYDLANNLQNKASVTYNQNGNINTKSDAGDYVYGQTNKPYQLTNLNNPVGNTSLNTLNVSYNDFKKVSQVTEATSNKQFDFIYGNNEERIKMDYSIGSTNQYTRFYADNYDRQETGSGYKEWNYIFAPTGLAAVYYDNNGTGQLLYSNTDHLGSVTMLTNSVGLVVEEYSYDAWGRRRNSADWNDYTNLSPSLYMIRGFTMHEHLNEVGIINMNGRIYDPVLGRFLQPDDMVQEPSNLQNYNRYSYVMNNPLKYADPSGNEYLPEYNYSLPNYNFSVPTYQVPSVNYSSNSYNYSYNSGYGGANYGYGGSYSTNYSGNFTYGGTTGNYNFSTNFSYYSSTNYNADYVSMSSMNSMGYSFGASYGNQSYNMSYNSGYSYNVSYANYDYQAKMYANQAEAYVSNLGQSLSIADVGVGFYTGYLHNYDTYISTAGKELSFYTPSGTLRNTAQAASYMRYNNMFKFVGTSASVLSTAYSGYKIYDGSATTMDKVDFGVGSVGLGVAGAAALGVIGAAAAVPVGIGVSIYGGARLLGDVIGGYNPGGPGVGQYYDYGIGLYMIK